MKCFSLVAMAAAVAVAAMSATTSVEAQALRGLAMDDLSVSSSYDDAIIGNEGDADEEPQEDPDFDQGDADGDDVDDRDGSDDGSAAADYDPSSSDSSDGSDSTKSYGFDSLSRDDKHDVAGVFPHHLLSARDHHEPAADSDVKQVGPKPLPQTPAPTATTQAPPPIGESAAAAKDISSIDSSAIQRDPESYGVVTTAPPATTAPSPATVATPSPPPIGESAAAAKDISSIDSSAIQRDPTSYGVVTPTPSVTTSKLVDSPAAAHPADQSSKANSPVQRSAAADELDH